MSELTAGAPGWKQPSTLAELNLPPSFVTDHALRTLFYQGPSSAAQLAAHWRVPQELAVEIVESLRSLGLAELDAAQRNLDQLGRIRLSSTGQGRVASARQRTWYAGPLPVSMTDLARRMGHAEPARASVEDVRSALAPFAIDDRIADGVGQAIGGGAVIAIAGFAHDEQAPIAQALAASLTGDMTLPYALFASGAVVRVFHPTYRRADDHDAADPFATVDILRRKDEAEQWSTGAPGVVALSGGVLPSDVVPAYDDEARFYIAPAPFTACGGVLAILDSHVDAEGLAQLARLWLVPGQHETGILVLRSGERLEVPWRAATLLFGAQPQSLPAALRDAPVYAVDASALEGASLCTVLASRLPDQTHFPQGTVEALAAFLERSGQPTRVGAAAIARYLRDRVRYERDAFRLTEDVLRDAVAFAGVDPSARGRGQLRPAA